MRRVSAGAAVGRLALRLLIATALLLDPASAAVAAFFTAAAVGAGARRTAACGSHCGCESGSVSTFLFSCAWHAHSGVATAHLPTAHF